MITDQDLLLRELSPDAEILREGVLLPCGRTVRNRMCKVAMYESLADFGGGMPNGKHFKLYSKWGHGGWGMIITGNIQVDQRHLSLGRDLIVPKKLTPETTAPYIRLAQCIHQPSSPSRSLEEPLAIMQLNHTGRQSPQIVGGRGLMGAASAPSAVPVRSRDGTDGIISEIIYRVLFPMPIALEDDEVDGIIESFVHGAKVAHQTGFDGVQIHCAHGYLFAQFLSPKTNLRQGRYGFPNELHVVHEIIRGIRSVVPPSFVIGVKINAADYVNGGLSEDKALAHVKGIADWEMTDFIEISGGDYEKSEFGERANPRQAFFSRFSRLAMEVLSPRTEKTPMIVLTGSLRTQSLMAETIRAQHADLVGIGRPSVVYPNFPRIILSSKVTPPVEYGQSTDLSDPNHIYYAEPPSPAWLKLVNTSLIGAGIGTAWHCALMSRIATGRWDGLKSRSGTRDAAMSIQEVQDTSLSRSEMPRIGGIRSLYEMWS
ncbi:hypothetical protein FRB95_013983 [Tulasnella sp. JGI-2019a]|nr:hypothetical protein FRB95_013983 [Tulasnella sp. JGI-2019a]